jgi:hypothetical protein
MLAQKQPPFKECVIAHWSRDSAPKMSGAKVHGTEALACIVRYMGRGAFLHGIEAVTGRTGGQAGSENAGMSSEKKVRILPPKA